VFLFYVLFYGFSSNPAPLLFPGVILMMPGRCQSLTKYKHGDQPAGQPEQTSDQYIAGEV
jgi:hypothetical protein